MGNKVDASLFAAAQAGDRGAMETLLVRLQPDLRRYARRQCRSSSVIDDVVQEALLIVYRKVGTVREPAALASWVFRVIGRLCLLPALMVTKGVEALTQETEQAYFAQASTQDLRLDLINALESLPVDYREVILLRDMEQLTISEMAQRLGLSRPAVKSRLHRARTMVREYLLEL